MKSYELPAEKLRWCCQHSGFDFKSTEEIPPPSTSMNASTEGPPGLNMCFTPLKSPRPSSPTLPRKTRLASVRIPSFLSTCILRYGKCFGPGKPGIALRFPPSCG